MSENHDRAAKSEEATEKKLSDAAAKGQLPFSRDLPGLLAACAIWIALAFLISGILARVAAALRPFWDSPFSWSIETPADTSMLLRYLAEETLAPLIPMLCLVAAASLAGSLAQSRGFAIERIRPQLSRISPASGWQRIFGSAGLGHAFRSIAGLLLIGCVAATALLGLMRESIALQDTDPDGLLAGLPAMAARLLATMLGAMLVVAAVDTLLSRYSWRRGLRMRAQPFCGT